MLQIGSHSACVIVDGVELPQYSTEHSIHHGRPQVTCWIASEAGKEFFIRLEDSLSAFDTLGDIKVDGVLCGSLRLYTGRKTRAELSVTRVSSTSARSLMFSHVQLTDEEKNVNHAVSLELGEIRLKIIKAKLIKAKAKVKKAGTKIVCVEKLTETAMIHERSKKAIGHHVQLGKEVASPRSGYEVKATSIQVLGTVIFKYRPLDMLQANGIAPLDKKRKRAISLPNEEDAVRKSDTEDAKRIKALEEELRLIKDKAQARNPKKLKSEVKQENGIGWLPGEVIDLT